MDEVEENEKPDSWLDDLTELIKRKKAENELLKKLRGVVSVSGDDQGNDPTDMAAEIKKEQEKQS